MSEMTYADALSKADHMLALGHDTVYLHGDDIAWDRIVEVEAGSGWRLSGPVGIYLIARERGLTFRWTVDFESRDANGTGHSAFDRARLRDVMMRLPAGARAAFVDVLRVNVLPALSKNTAEWRDILQRQWDSEDCVRGLIALGSGEKA